MLANHEGRPSAYDSLAVHPNAPAELIATSYWFLAGELQRRREQGEYVDDALHELTRAYERVSDPERRSAYDAAIGHTLQPLAKRSLPPLRRSLRSRLIRRGVLVGPLDHYEVLGISRATPPGILPAAYRIMRDQYFRTPHRGNRRPQLLRLLDEAYATLSVAEMREKYDERTRRKAVITVGVVPAGRKGTSLGDSPESARELHNVPTSTIAVPSPDVLGPVTPAGAEQHPKKRSLMGKWIGAALRVLAHLPAAGARLLHWGLSGGAGLAAKVWSGRPTRRSLRARGADTRPLQRRQIVREPPPRSQVPSVDVEDALLGRLEASVKDTLSRLAAEKQDADPPSSRSTPA